MYGVFKELQSLTRDGRLLVCAEAAFDGYVVMVVAERLLVCAEAAFDGHVVMVVADGEALETQEKIVVPDGKVVNSVMADGGPTVGSVVWGTVAVQGSLQV